MPTIALPCGPIPCMAPAHTWKGRGTDRPAPRAGSRGLLLPCVKHAAAAARPSGEEPRGCCGDTRC